MIGQQQPVVRLDVLPDGGRQLRRRRRGVVDDRDAAERADHLGQHGAVQRHAGDRKPGGQRRMRVHDGVHVGPLPVHLEVHQQLGRGIAVAGDLLAVEIDDDHHVGRHVPLGHALRRRQDAVRRRSGC